MNRAAEHLLKRRILADPTDIETTDLIDAIVFGPSNLQMNRLVINGTQLEDGHLLRKATFDDSHLRVVCGIRHGELDIGPTNPLLRDGESAHRRPALGELIEGLPQGLSIRRGQGLGEARGIRGRLRGSEDRLRRGTAEGETAQQQASREQR